MTGLDHDSKRNPKLRAAISAAPAADGTALGRAFVKAVVDLCGLDASAIGHGPRRARVNEFSDDIESGAFVAVVQDPAGRVGLFVLAETGFLSLIEAMTMGALLPRAPAPRLPTATDAALLRDLVDRTVHDFGTVATGFSFDRPLLNLRLIDLVLEADSYDLIESSVTVSYGKIQRETSLLLILPPPDTSTASDPAHGAGAADPGWTQALDAVVMEAPAALRAELGRLQLPLADVLALGPGAMMTLPLSNLEDVRLCSSGGQELARARLGQWRGMRAVRVMTVMDGTAQSTGLPLGAPFTEASGSALRSDPE